MSPNIIMSGMHTPNNLDPKLELLKYSEFKVHVNVSVA